MPTRFPPLSMASFGLAACLLAIANHICAQPSVVAARVDRSELAQNFPGATGTVLPALPAYPLKVSANHRYLVDQNNVPFLMVGDAPQTLIVNLSQAEAATYMADRRRFGINALWINLICNYSDGCNKDAATIDGISPFIVSGDLSTPNPAYFKRADEMLAMAATNGMVVLLDPIETTSWLDVLRSNGPAKAFAFGQYLGNRYKDQPNIIWLHGNDFQTWRNATDDALVQAVARGIRSADRNHLQTVELNYFTSGSLDDPTWAPLIELDAAYTYFPTYAQVLNEYNRPNFKPVFMVEANYEFEHNGGTDGGSVQNLRRQEYWTMLSGATGQLYGSAYTWRLERGWQTRLDTPGVRQLSNVKGLFSSLRWYDLIPDQEHVVVTSGYHGGAGFIGRLARFFGQSSGWEARVFHYFKKLTGLGSVSTNTYASAASTCDGSLVVAYLPTIRPVAVDMSKLAGPARARWYDPTNGKYLDAGDLPLPDAGRRWFSPPGNNSAGDGDWVLLLEVSAARTDVGGRGTYQRFSSGGRAIGGMFTKPSVVPVPFWLYYFNTGDIDSAAKRVRSGNGQILNDAIEVPGGAWVMQCTDPQGAIFGLIGERRHMRIVVARSEHTRRVG